MAGEQLPGRQDLQVLVGGERRVPVSVSVPLRIVGAAGLEGGERADCGVAVVEFLEPLAGAAEV